MSFLLLLRHRLRAFVRDPFVGRRAASLLIGGFMALYFGGGLVLLGLALDDLVRQAAPGADPLLIAARWLGPFAIAYAAVRVIAESGLGANPRPYLHLPVRRGALAGVLAALALVSLWNAAPLAFLAAVCAEAAVSGPGGPALRLGLAGVGVLAAATYAVPMLRETLSGRPLLSAGIVLLAAGSVAVEATGTAGGIASLPDASEWLLGGVVRGGRLEVAVSLALLGAVAVGYRRWLQGAMALDRGAQDARRSGGGSSRLDRLARRGPAWREAVLDARRYLRNKQLRVTLFLSPLMVGLVGYAGYEITSLQALAGGTAAFVNILFVGLFATGFHIIQGGPNLFSYEGRQLDALQSRPVPIRERMRGRWLFLALGALVLFALPLPVMLWTWSPFGLFHTAFFLYNVGLVAPAMLAASTFNRKAVDANQHSMASSPGITAGRIALMLPVLGLPVLPRLFGSDPTWHLGLVAAMGLASAAALPLWQRALAALYRRNRHAMMRGFRSSE